MEIAKLRKELDNIVGKRIDHFCKSSLADDHAKNQCAHFVSHMLDYDLSKPASCKYRTLADKKAEDVTGATMRVDVIFNHISKLKRHQISDYQCYPAGLIFATQQKNIKANGEMGTMPRKHIGILVDFSVYHYGNLDDKVKKHDLNYFMQLYSKKYGGAGPVVFYRGDFIK